MFEDKGQDSSTLDARNAKSDCGCNPRYSGEGSTNQGFSSSFTIRQRFYDIGQQSLECKNLTFSVRCDLNLTHNFGRSEQAAGVEGASKVVCQK
jgi:hypothetical protein